MAAPPCDALPIHRLKRTSRLTDIVVARDAQHTRAELRQEGGAIAHVLLNIGSINRHISRMNDQVRRLCAHPGEQRSPVLGKVRLARAEMGIGDL